MTEDDTMRRRSFGALFAAGSTSTVLPGSRGSAASIISVNVRDFGASGDGTADDAPSINRAVADVRQRQSEMKVRRDLGCRLEFPTGIYRVKGPLNFSGLRAINTLIDGRSSVILGECAGAPVIDALGSRWLTIRDLTIVGVEGAAPDCGFQLGCIEAGVVADDHLLSNVKIVGHFSLACLYNRGGETSCFEHLLLWNHRSGGYCLIQDGLNHFSVQSQFCKVTLKPDDALSFNENLFLNCDIRHRGEGVPIWLAHTSRHQFFRCYAATEGDTAFLIFGNHVMLSVDCHCEGRRLGALFYIDGPRPEIELQGFTFLEHECFANSTVFFTAPAVKHVSLYNARIEIASFHVKTAKVFSDPERWRASGTYWSNTRETWNGDAVYSGVITLGLSVKMLRVAS